MKNTLLLCFSFLVVIPFSSMSYAAASHNVTPLSTDVKPYYPASVTKNEPVTNADYSTLPTCAQSTINCKDINGNLADSKSPEFCPDACTVSDVVTPYYVGGVASPTYLAAYSPATCPKGYTTGTGYGYSKEVVYAKNPPPFPMPIPSKQTYDSYRADPAIVCTQDSTIRTFNYCDTGSASYPAGKEDMYQGGYGIIIDTGKTNKCYDQYTCPGPSTLSCSLSTTKRLYQPKYVWYKCTPPSGNMYTDKFAPSSKVCRRTHVQWQTN